VNCDNDSSMGHTVINPQCFKGVPSFKVAVQYNEVESDTLTLCADCAQAVKRDARRHGYKVTTKRI